MTQFHKNLILFGLVFGLVFLVFNWRLQNNMKSDIELKFEELYKPSVNAEIVLLGTSHAAHGVNPKYININNLNLYNFALNGSNPSYYNSWYKNIFKKHYPKPKYLIYAVDWAMFYPHGAHRSIDVDARLYSWEDYFRILFNEKGLDKKTFVFNRIPMFYHTKKLEYVFYKKKHFDEIVIEDYYQGYVTDNFKYNKMFPKNRTIYNSNIIINEFDQFLSAVEHDSINVIFVLLPEFAPSWPDKTAVKKHIGVLDSIAKSRSIPFINYNKEPFDSFNIDSTNFRNWIHLSEKGATQFSKIFNTDLQKLID